MPVSRFFVHTVTVETFLGTSGYGVDQFAAPVTLSPPNGCFVDNARHLVRSTTAEEVLSEATLYTFVANAALFAPNSRVTVNGVQTRVIKTNPNTSGSLRLPDHVAVTLA